MSTIPEHAYFTGITRLEAEQRAFQRQLELAQGSTAAVRQFWEAEERRCREFEAIGRLSGYGLSALGLSATVAASETFRNVTAYLQHDTAYHLMERSIQDGQRMYEQAAMAGLAVSRLENSIGSALVTKPWLAPLDLEFRRLAASGTTVYEALGGAPAGSVVATDWQLAAPSLLPYSAAETLATLGGVEPSTNADSTTLAATFDAAGEQLESKIRAVKPALVVPYRGALEVLEARGSDWPRHLGASVRTLGDELLSALAPDQVLEMFFEDPEAQKMDRQFTREAKLTYIFRDIAVGPYAEMVNNDIEMTMAIFFPANAAVHSLVPTLTQAQGRVFLRRVQGCLATILATVEA